MANTAYVIYHHEPEGWWAESPQYPEYAAFGKEFAEVQLLALEGLRFAAEDPTLTVVDLLPTWTIAKIVPLISGVPKTTTAWGRIKASQLTGLQPPVPA
jgi:predicted RNase H-like HicB family nuclease